MQGSSSPSEMLTELPVIVVDSLLTNYVSNNDLRVIHQVSKGWKDLIEKRPLVNARRIALVNTIREHKENILKSTQPLVLPAPLVTEPKPTDESKSKEREDEKPGSGGRALRPTSANNHVFVTPGASSARSTTRSKKSGRSTGSTTRISSTPISSRFQRRYEAGLKLMAGQVLFSCPECKSPVASPLVAREGKFKSNPVPTINMDSGFPLTPSIESDYSSILTRQEGSSSNLFEFKSPDFDSINISMIVTPPYTPPNYGDGGNHTNRSEDLQNTRSPSCPFLASISALSIPDSSHGVEVIEGSPAGTSSSFSEPQPQLSQDSGLGSPRVKLKSRGFSPSPSLLRSLHSKQLKLKSSSSPSLLVSEINNNEPSEENGPVVVQCPDCSYRFCTLCMFREHPGTPCHLIGGGDIEADEEEDHHSCFGGPTRPISKPRPRSAHSAGSGGKSGKKNKGSLRRLACL